MPGVCQLTITGKVGAGASITAQVLTGVTFYSVDPINKVINVTSNGVIVTVDINGATTFTTTISGANYTLVVS